MMMLLYIFGLLLFAIAMVIVVGTVSVALGVVCWRIIEKTGMLD